MNNAPALRLRSLFTASCFTLVASLGTVAGAFEGPALAGASGGPALASAVPPPTPAGTVIPGIEPQTTDSPQLVAPLTLAEAPKPSKGFLDFNSYPYLTEVDNDSVFTLNALAKLPYGFTYFSLLNLNNQSDEQPLSDTTGYYTEQNLRFAPSPAVPLELTVQYNLRSGDDNDRLRFGFLWKLHDTPLVDRLFDAIHLTYAVNFHVLQIDHEDAHVWQMEHIAQLTTPYLDRRLYVAGFADHTFNGAHPEGSPAAPLVMEVQAGLRLVDELHAIAEYRINEYRVESPTNIALGAEYVARF